MFALAILVHYLSLVACFGHGDFLGLFSDTMMYERRCQGLYLNQYLVLGFLANGHVRITP